MESRVVGMLIQAIPRLKVAAAPPPADIQLLTEIRDLLKDKK